MRIFWLLISLLVVGCSGSSNVKGVACEAPHGGICVDILRSASSGAASADASTIAVSDASGLGKSTVLSVTSADEIKYRWENGRLVLAIQGGLIDGFKSYWFNPTTKSHDPDGDLKIVLEHRS